MSIDNTNAAASNNADEGKQKINPAEAIAAGAEALAGAAAQKVHNAGEAVGAAAEAMAGASPAQVSDLAKALAAKQAARAERMNKVVHVGKKVGISAGLIGLGVVIGHLGSQHMARRVVLTTATNPAADAPAV